MRRSLAYRLGWFVTTLGTLAAPLDAAPPVEMGRLIEQARSQITPPSADAVDRAWRDVVKALDAVDAHLAKASAEVRQGWLDYLHLGEVRELNTLSSLDEKLTALEKLRLRMTVDRPGLEAAPLLQLRSAAQKYANALQWSTLDVPRETQSQLAKLRTLLDKYAVKPDRATAEQLGATLAWLENGGQATQLVAAIREQWSHPNFVLQIQESFAAHYAKKNVEQTSDQVTNVLGTITRGPAATKAKLAVEFRPNEQQAEIWLRLHGEIHADQNVGRNGPATIYSASVTDFTAIKPIVIDPQLGIAGRHAFAEADTKVQIRQIQVDPKHFKNLLDGPFTKAAWKKSRKIHGAAEHEASRIAGNRVAEQLEEQSTTSILTGQQTIGHYLFVGPQRAGETIALSSRSTDDALQICLQVAGSHQLAAPGGLPTLDPHAPISTAIHESMLSNLSARYALQGATHDDEAIEKLAKMLAGEVPIPLRVYSSSPYWAVTLDVEHPLTLAFDDGQIELTIHTRRWRLEEREFDCPLEIHVRYGVEATKFGARFTRTSPVTITPLSSHKLSEEERQVLLPLVEKKAAAMFPESGRFNNLIMPDGGTFGPIGDLKLHKLTCDEGWLTMEYK
ncbi:MAG: hypothetical protein JNM18_16910 [Planctomycetaceae bacterium]|nr:hypothetical protein [Planctomycetaceae bacterium]